MMAWTTRAFHGKYTHRLLIDTRDLDHDPVQLFRATAARQFRKLDHNVRSPDGLRTRQAVTIYCFAQLYDDIRQRYGERVTHVTEPADADSEALIAQGVQLVIRERPWFNRYLWSMTFSGSRRHPLEIKQWARQAFGDDSSLYSIRGRWIPTLYLRDDDTALMARLSIGDRVLLTRKVLLLPNLPQL